MTATRNVIDQEKMAVILQEVVGKDYGTRYYPTMSGVLRSLNYYPIGDEEAEEGIASLALGLGKYIVDGGQTLRVVRIIRIRCCRLPRWRWRCAIPRPSSMPST